MKKLIYREGNLLTSREIGCCAHQANCQNTFGSGIARTIREMYPDAYKADCDAAIAKVNTLGNFSMAYIPEEQSKKHNTQIKKIFNLYGQNLYGRSTRQTNYDALYSALEGMANDLNHTLKVPTVGFPYQMGSFRGGGSWDVVSRLIEVAFDDYPSDVIIYRLDAN